MKDYASKIVTDVMSMSLSTIDIEAMIDTLHKKYPSVSIHTIVGIVHETLYMIHKHP